MPDPTLIQAVKPDAYAVRIEPFVVPPRAPIRSERLNLFAQQVLTDLTELSRQGNTIASALLNGLHVAMKETSGSRMLGAASRRQEAYRARVSGLQGHKVGIWHDLHDGRPISFLEASTISRRAAVSTQYGQATIPMNAVEARTYSLAVVASGRVSALNAVLTATGSFDKDEGVQDYEGGGDQEIEQTDLQNAANGNNDQFWRRRVILPLESDVSEVEVELTLQLPDQSSIRSNVIYLHPFPLEGVDVTGLWTSSDLSGAFSLVEGFEEILGAEKTRWFLPAQDVARVKVRLRQRNWEEEDGRKVFEYGLQELGVQLVEWDKAYDAASSVLTDNHTFVSRIVPPDGTLFGSLYAFDSDPVYTLEPSGSRHLHFVLARDREGTEVVWNSDTTAAPQLLSLPLDLGAAEELFLITTLNWADTVSVGSPFLAGCPPFLRGFGITVLLTEAP